MKMNIITLIILTCSLSNAQVGINTTDPQATLDINGNLKVRTIPASSVASTYDFLVINSANSELQKVNGSLGTSTDSFSDTMVKAVEEEGLSLLSGSLFAGWQKIDFGSGHVPINPGSHFDTTTDFYTVPSDGIYEINYEMRYGSGVLLSLVNFSGIPSIGVLKHNSSGYTVLDKRKFSGVSVPLLASIIVSNTTIDSMYELTAGEKLSFEVNAGGLALNVLGDSYASVIVRKISN